jgi:hypothetical protein
MAALTTTRLTDEQFIGSQYHRGHRSRPSKSSLGVNCKMALLGGRVGFERLHDNSLTGFTKMLSGKKLPITADKVFRHLKNKEVCNAGVFRFIKF